MPEKRTFHPRTRLHGVRSSKLIVIATEGLKTEPSYFDALASSYASKRTHVEIIVRQETAPDPQRVLSQLRDFKKSYKLKPNDELWLVIDVDRWTNQMLSDVTSQALQMSASLAVSNPCFEIWLLLHHRALSDYDQSVLGEFLLNSKDGTSRSRLERELITIVGEFNKANLNTDGYILHVDKAIQNAESVDTSKDERWPQEIGTHVYRLAKHIIEK
jgi:hypothetical protein